MKAAIVQGAGQPPVYADFEAPVAGPDERHIQVSASALSPLTKARASGAHYSATGSFPFIAGMEGVGRADDGERVYFVLPRAPFGGLAEQTVAPAAHCLPLPDDMDDVMAAAIANPGMSSWAALTERARLVAGETVLINGATGASGQLAVRIARHLGARKVIATGRDASALAALGADATIPLTGDAEELEASFRAHFAAGVDVVLDYLWGMSAERLLIAAAKAGPPAVPLRVVQIGTASGLDIRLPGAVLRASAIQLMGSGIGSVPLPRLLAAIDGVLRAAATAGLALDVRTAPLSDIGQAWDLDDRTRTVITIG